MAERQLKKLQYDNKDIVAEVANRDGAGNIITDTYTRINNQVTSISSTSTDIQYPSAKCVYDNITNVREVAEGLKQTYVVSDVNNPLFNSQEDIILLSSSFTDINNNTIQKSALEVGDSIYVTELDVPDRWMCGKKANDVIQLVKYQSGRSVEVNGISVTNNNNGSFTISGTTTALTDVWIVLDSSSGLGLTSSHKYLLKSYCQGASTTGYRIRSEYNSANTCDTGSGVIFTASSSTSRIIILVTAPNTTAIPTQTIWPQLFDLTLMYGVGHEPSTVAEFEQDYPEHYYEFHTTLGDYFCLLSKLETAKVPIESISVNGTNIQPILSNVNIDTNIYPVGNTNYRIQFKVVNGQPQLEYEEVI